MDLENNLVINRHILICCEFDKNDFFQHINKKYFDELEYVKKTFVELFWQIMVKILI